MFYVFQFPKTWFSVIAKRVFSLFQFPPWSKACFSVFVTFRARPNVFCSFSVTARIQTCFQFVHSPALVQTCFQFFCFAAPGQTCFLCFPVPQTCFYSFQFPKRGFEFKLRKERASHSQVKKKKKKKKKNKKGKKQESTPFCVFCDFVSTSVYYAYRKHPATTTKSIPKMRIHLSQIM